MSPTKQSWASWFSAASSPRPVGCWVAGGIAPPGAVGVAVLVLLRGGAELLGRENEEEGGGGGVRAAAAARLPPSWPSSRTSATPMPASTTTPATTRAM